MAVLIIMPKQGQSVESCIIADIKKKGDAVKKGDILFSYETDKATFEEESPADGIILERFYNEGDEVPVLENVMIIGEPGEDYSALMVESKPENTHAQDVVEHEENNVGTQTSQPAVIPKEHASSHTISPRAKRLAAEKALDTSPLAGSGPQGRIIEKDIVSELDNRPKLTPLAIKIISEEKLQAQGGGSGLAGTVKSSDLSSPINPGFETGYEDRKLSNIRKIIAKAMHASLQNSAQLTHHLGADARQLLDLRKQAKKALEENRVSVNITLNDMVCFAVVKALRKFPNVNSHFLGDTVRYFNKVHLGVAVDTDRGLMVPVVRNADDLSIIGLANQLKELASACRKGAVNPEILSPEAGTFTVSNLGNYGVEIFTPIINLPQSAILGVNTIVPRPKDLGDGVYAFVPYIGLSLTYDHRSLDGGEATRFVKQIAIELENLEIDFS